MKTLIYGAGGTGRRIYMEVKNSTEVIGFLDNNKSCWGRTISDDSPSVLGNVDILNSIEYDEIIIASLTGFQAIKNQLKSAGVPAEKIRTDYVETQINARINFLHDFAEINKEAAKQYAVAEGGVFQGEFAKEINYCFPNSALYLFDTFEGFDPRDLAVDTQIGHTSQTAEYLSLTSEKLVLNKLHFKDKAIIRKGYFPETAIGLENTKYFFVNLDFDLYNPIIAGLRFFVPRLAPGGVILVHDFFNPGYLGVAQAISDYEKECKIKLHKFPIGDHCSLGIMI